MRGRQSEDFRRADRCARWADSRRQTIHALEYNVDRLGQDHANAERLAKGLIAMGLKVELPQTNLVFATIPKDSVAEFERHLQAHGWLRSSTRSCA